MTMTPEEKEEKRRKIVEKHKKELSDAQYREFLKFRSDMIYGLDCCDLMSDIRAVMCSVAEHGSDKLYDLLKETHEALYQEQLRIADVTFENYSSLLKARDELKKKKKKGKR